MQNELAFASQNLLHAEIILNEQTFFFSFSLPCQTQVEILFSWRLRFFLFFQIF